jgi:hypothetical protein
MEPNAKRQSKRIALLNQKANELGFSTWKKLETAYLSGRVDFTFRRIFNNISDRYGEGDAVTIADYQELNPTGNFEIVGDTIREYFEDGTWETVAE